MAIRWTRPYVVAGGLVLLGLGAMLALGASAVRSLDQGLEAVAHRHGAHLQIRTVQARLLEFELARRGGFPYDADSAAAAATNSAARLDGALAVLGEIVEHHARQHPDFDRLLELVAQQRRAAADAPPVGPTDARFADLNALIERMVGEETRELEQVLAAIDSDVQLSARLMAVLSVAIALLLVGVYLLLRRERAQAERADRAESAAMAALERRVDERTQALAQVASALERSESRQRRLLRLLPEAVYVDTGGRVGLVNDAMLALTGKAESDLVGHPPEDIFHPDSHALLAARAAELLAGRTLALPIVEQRIVRGDGAVRTVEVLAARISDDAGGPSIVVVMRDVTDLRRVQSELARSHADLRRLVAAQDHVREDERRRIARELHDDLQQTLAAIRVDVSTAAARIAADAAEAGELLAGVDQLAGAAMVSTRRIVNDLRPQLLDDLGLVPALELLAEQFTQRTGVACSVEEPAGDCDAAVTSPVVATCLYRVAQEALNNVAKHAQARRVWIEIECHAGERALLRVRDDGRGIAEADRSKPDSVGLLGMQERVRSLGGSLDVHSVPGTGTTVEAAVPVSGTGARPEVEAMDGAGI